MLFLQLFLYVVFADSSLAFSLNPMKGNYTLSVAQCTADLDWEGVFEISGYDRVSFIYPSKAIFSFDASRLSYVKHDQSISLLSFIPEEMAYTYARPSFSLSFIPFDSGQRGMEVSIGSDFTMFCWNGVFAYPRSFQQAWDAQYAAWGIASRFALPYLQIELLFTPVTGIVCALKQQLASTGFQASIAYGGGKYPVTYGWNLSMQKEGLSVQLEQKDAYGERPVYGGWFKERNWKQTCTIRFESEERFYQMVITNSSIFSSDRRKESVSELHLQMALSVCTLSMYQVFNDGLDWERYSVSAEFSHAIISYGLHAFKIILSDSLVVGSGVVTWRIAKQWGKRMDCQILYQRPIH